MNPGELGDKGLYWVLEQIDADLARTAQAQGCGTCGGVLHRADYPRKPRGGWRAPDDEYRRFSFCCAGPVCRDRLTPPSVRFLGRKVYWGAVVVLMTALRHGPTPMRLARLQEICGASARTLARWRRWWTDTFAQSRFWKAAQGLLATPVSEDQLPLSLLARFAGDDRDRLLATLRFLSPITSRSAGVGVF
jgi:hypothetical protein